MDVNYLGSREGKQFGRNCQKAWDSRHSASLGAVLRPWTHASLRGCDLGFPRPPADSWAREKRKQESCSRGRWQGTQARWGDLPSATRILFLASEVLGSKCGSAVHVIFMLGPSCVRCGVDMGLRTPCVPAPVPTGPTGLAALGSGSIRPALWSPSRKGAPRATSTVPRRHS